MMQSDLFNSDMNHCEPGGVTKPSHGDRLICWTKMQTESGQSLDLIVARKELERRAGNGIFYWGIGNALSVRNFSGDAQIPIYFSKMISRPKEHDRNPSGVLLWRKYRDERGDVRDLPGHTIILSKSSSSKSNKIRHYALVCYSKSPLILGDFGSFYPGHYINAGGSRKPMGFSQVTSLLTPASADIPCSEYKINLRAKLVQPFLVTLIDPVLLTVEDRKMIDEGSTGGQTEWAEFARHTRNRLERAPSFTKTTDARRGAVRHMASLV